LTNLGRYDFDSDGWITSEDVRLILSHVPIVNTKTGSGIKEGSFTTEGGGHHSFKDRLQAVQEISNLL
jgi:hypothetical protein